MDTILKEKHKEHQDLWKTCNVEVLTDRLFRQIRTLVLGILTPQRIKRKLIHIANYCFFLYTRLEKGDL